MPEDCWEQCVICGFAVFVNRDTPVECRKNYVEGCGQLCEGCAADVHREQWGAVIPSDAIESLVKGGKTDD